MSDMYNNPVQRGFFPAPSVVRVGDDYYMANSTFQYFPAIAISHSKDMIHWHVIGHAITDSEELDLRDIKDSHGIWAPDINYVDGKFIIMATLRLNGDGKRDNNVLRRQLVVTSDKPQETHKKDKTKKKGESVCVWPGTGERCPEGPHIFKKGEYYYAMLAEGGTGYGHGINVARSKNLYGPYEESPYNPVLRQFNPDAPIKRTGHGNIIETQDGSWWCYYLCGRPSQGNYTTVGRETALGAVTWL